MLRMEDMDGLSFSPLSCLSLWSTVSLQHSRNSNNRTRNDTWWAIQHTNQKIITVTLVIGRLDLTHWISYHWKLFACRTNCWRTLQQVRAKICCHSRIIDFWSRFPHRPSCSKYLRLHAHLWSSWRNWFWYDLPASYCCCWILLRVKESYGYRYLCRWFWSWNLRHANYLSICYCK